MAISILLSITVKIHQFVYQRLGLFIFLEALPILLSTIKIHVFFRKYPNLKVKVLKGSNIQPPSQIGGNIYIFKHDGENTTVCLPKFGAFHFFGSFANFAQHN